MRSQVPWQTLATGEHQYARSAMAASRRLVDIFQPDILWGGGITGIVKICHIAEAAGISVVAVGMNLYGKHVAFAMPTVMWGDT